MISIDLRNEMKQTAWKEFQQSKQTTNDLIEYTQTLVEIDEL